MTTNSKLSARRRRQFRARRRIVGTAERPRLAVFRSAKHIYAQVIDDERGHTIAAASSLADGITPQTGGDDDGDAASTKVSVAQQVGTLVAERAQAAGVEQVVFDRAGNRYAGRVAALADAARAAGLEL